MTIRGMSGFARTMAVVAAFSLIAVTARAGTLFVADYSPSRVLAFPSPFADGEDADHVIGQPDFMSEGPALSRSGINGPTGVFYQKQSGMVWVVDTVNQRVLGFKGKFTDGQDADVVLGQGDFMSATAATSKSGLSQPYAVTGDSHGNLWVADLGNSRVLEFKPPFTSDKLASRVIGEPNFNTKDAIRRGMACVGRTASHSIITAGSGCSMAATTASSVTRHRSRTGWQRSMCSAKATS